MSHLSFYIYVYQHLYLELYLLIMNNFCRHVHYWNSWTIVSIMRNKIGAGSCALWLSSDYRMTAEKVWILVGSCHTILGITLSTHHSKNGSCLRYWSRQKHLLWQLFQHLTTAKSINMCCFWLDYLNLIWGEGEYCILNFYSSLFVYYT